MFWAKWPKTKGIKNELVKNDKKMADTDRLHLWKHLDKWYGSGSRNYGN